MSAPATMPSPVERERGALASLAFGTTVAMWLVGYFGRLPGVMAPGWLLAAAFLGLIVVGGYVAGRHTRGGGAGRGLAVGALVALLNMLVLGSLLSGEEPGSIVPSALVWVPGALLSFALLGALGGALGRWARAASGVAPPRRCYVSVFAIVAAFATLTLVGTGGLVTTAEAGLAVVDWPNSFGYNMFLYPLSRMSGGIYYEHAHRLMGSLVGLTTLTLAGLVLVSERHRKRLGALALLAVVMVIGQGVLGGLRVTGRFTLSTEAADMAPSTALALVHGVTGQLFFALLVGIAVLTSPTWTGREPRREHLAARGTQVFAALFAASIVGQLVLGALYRHTGQGLLLHIVGATFVTVLAIGSGLRTWGLHGPERGGHAILGRLGLVVMSLVGLQLLLGIAALTAVLLREPGSAPPLGELIFATLHQKTGAIVLAASLMQLLWAQRLLAAPAADSSALRAGLEAAPPAG